MRERWSPDKGRGIYNLDKLTAGDLVALDAPKYRHKAWRVHEIRGWNDDRLRVVFRPDGAQFDFAQHNVSLLVGKYAPIYWLPEHYGLCHRCGEVTPCSEVWSERISTEVSKQSARFEVEGVCPSCQEPVTARQKSHRFEENLRVPLGPPVIFHARHKCGGGAVEYDCAVAAATGREPRLFCEGLRTKHLDGHETCTNITCPSLSVGHRTFAMCYALNAKCNRPECMATEDQRRAP